MRGRFPRPGYEVGVVSPLVAHAHPYPTRFHGGIWTRPVFGFPWVTAPTNVHQETDMRGLGMVVDTGDGLFLRPTGAPSYGGGVFDGNYPMSGVDGLGATAVAPKCPPRLRPGPWSPSGVAPAVEVPQYYDWKTRRCRPWYEWSGSRDYTRRAMRTAQARPMMSGLGVLGDGDVLGSNGPIMRQPVQVQQGVLSGDNYVPTMYQALALGALPASCKTVAKFNECDNKEYAGAQGYCYTLRDKGSYAPYTGFDDCVSKVHAERLEYNCAQYCPAGSGAQPYPWGVYSDKTKALQQRINVYLNERGFAPIGTDGKLGATTCGAARWIYNQPGMGGYVEQPGTCTSYAFTPVQVKCPAGEVLVEGKCVKSSMGGPACPAWSGMTTADCNVASGRPSALIKKLQSILGVPQTGQLDQATCAAWHTKVPKCGTLSPCPLNLVNIQDYVSGACKPRLCEPYSAYPFPPDPCGPGGACGPDEEMIDGKCQPKQAPPVKSSMMWLGLGALGLLAAGAYAMSQKKKGGSRRSTRRAA